jgi:hypothetical protein
LSRSNKSLAKATWQASSNAYRASDKGITHFAKWVTTDHTGFSRAMDEMPKMGFLDTLKYVALQFVVSIIGSIISGLLIFILVAFGIPQLIRFLLM